MPSLRSRHDRVVILCPIVVTGGAEAIHQLADAINHAGGEAHIAYYGPRVDLHLDADRVVCRWSSDPKPTAYAAYRSHTVEAVELTARSMVVAPEALVHRPFQHRTYQRALWWLSVDNGESVAPGLTYERERLRFFQSDDLMHFYQSDYARDFLMRSHARPIAPLTDYTNLNFLDRPINLDMKLTSGRRVVSYFPRKGGELAKSFFDAHGDLNALPIQGMDQRGVRNALLSSSVYVDFGHHPGKDRIPREAAMSGNIVFLHERGAARFYLDHPLEAAYLFTSEDVRSGALHARVKAALNDVAANFTAQSRYRTHIALEKAAFDLQVRDAFFELDW